MKRFFKKGLMGLLAFLMFVSPLSLQAAEETTTEFSISFEQEYVVPGDTLSVNVEGAEEGAYTISWSMNGSVVTNLKNQTSYKVEDGDLQKLVVVSATNEDNETVSTTMLISKLPVVYIDIANGEEITTKEPYRDAVIKIQSNSVYADMGAQYEGATEIKGRGNSTWSLQKKPYRLKFDKKSNVFGMGKSKHWVLLANYYDTSLLRNTLAYNLSGEMGLTYISTVSVDVVINGSKRGNYQLCEHIRVDEERVPVFDWEGFGEDVAADICKAENLDEDVEGDMADYLVENMGYITSGEFTFNGTTYKLADYDIEVPNITGGYAIELDEYYDEVSKFKSSLNQPLMFKGPEFVNTNKDMMNYISGYINAFEGAILNNNVYSTVYNGQRVHYQDLFDMDSLIDYWMVQELFFNEDAMKKSSYLYKEIDEKVKMGPIWDMDWSSDCMGDVSHTNKWQTVHFGANAQKFQWYKYLVQDPYFLSLAQVRYQEIRPLLEEMIEKDGIIDQQQVYMAESGADNDKLWPRGSFMNDSENLQNWLSERIEWLDTQFATKETFMDSIAGVEATSVSVKMSHEDDTPFNAKDNYNGEVVRGKNIKVKNDSTGTVTMFVNGYEVDTLESNETKVYNQDDIITDKDDTNVVTFAKTSSSGGIDFYDSQSFTLINEDVYVESIEVEGEFKTEYLLGDEAFDTTNFSVYANMSDQTRIDVTKDAIVTGFDTSKIGNVSMNVSYLDKNATFNIEVKEPEIKEFKVEGITHYELGNEFDAGKATIKVIYVNDVERDVTNEVTFEEKTFTKTGENQVKFNYKDTEDEITVIVFNHADLANLIDYAQVEVEKNDFYTRESIQEVEEVIIEVMNIYTNGTWDEVDQAIITLEDALNGMQIKIGDVENLKAEATNYKTVTLTWDDVLISESYNIYRKTPTSDEYKLVANVTDTTYSTTVVTGKEYGFKVSAVHSNQEGTLSDAVKVATQLEGKPELSIKKVGDARFTLKWTSIEGATRYIVYRKRNDDKMKKVLTLGAKDLEYTTAELPNGNYEFQVKAGRYDSVDRVMSDASNKVSGKVEALKPTVTVTAGSKSATISWKKMEGVTHYQVYRATSSGGKFTKLITTKELSYTAKSLSTGKKYYFKVRGYKTYKSGTDIKYTVYTPYSSEKSVTAK